MAWHQKTIRYWTVCWAFIIPYPCRKTKQQYCCSGPTRVDRYPFFSVNWICCDGKQYRFYRPRFSFSFGQDFWQICEACFDEIPKVDNEECVATVGEITGYECPEISVDIDVPV